MSNLLHADTGYSAPVQAPDFDSALDARPRNTARNLASEQHGQLPTVSIAISSRRALVCEPIYICVYTLADGYGRNGQGWQAPSVKPTVYCIN
jgi:hypothetical protein